jgi:''chromo'' (CHRromatin Organisation MOdifier) domain.
VYWKGFENSTATWEPVENLLSCGDLIEQFHRQAKPIPGLLTITLNNKRIPSLHRFCNISGFPIELLYFCPGKIPSNYWEISGFTGKLQDIYQDILESLPGNPWI